ncbi:MAG TPA: radical SAM protein, partial [Terriglobales bacterium]|nr:radical SAM protein [Terriglobales bacterium]
STAATVIPSVGCPMGCNFCTTSSFFGGKGKFFNFYNTGDELYEVMAQLEKKMNVTTFFVMDENFLLHKKRAMQLLKRMREGNKSWGMAVFSSANALRQYTMQELAELGISWVWMGLESPKSNYTKLDGADTKQLTRELAEHGIRVQGSTIIGLEHHTPENILDEIEYAVEHNTDFHQFMLYTPVPGTPLYKQIADEGRLLPDVDLADIHGQFKFNFRHAALSRDDSKRFLDLAFQRDFERNGPSLFRMCRTMLKGWKRYKNFPDARVRRRFENEMTSLSLGYNAALWAMEKKLRSVNPEVAKKVHALRKEIEKEFGLKSRLAGALAGPIMLWSANREEARLLAGHTYEPPTFLERTNWPAKPHEEFTPEPAGLAEPATA